MSLSKHQLSPGLKGKYLDLNEKIFILDYANEYTKMGCRKPAEQLSVGKTVISNILKDSKNLWMDYKFFMGSYKKRRHRKYHVINEILYRWCRKLTSANVYPDGPLLQEEGMEISKRLKKEEWTYFTAFTARKLATDMWRERKNTAWRCRKVYTAPVQASIERLP